MNIGVVQMLAGPLQVCRADRRPQVTRADIPAHYLSADYYFVQPPLQAKAFQEWCLRGFASEYEGRCARHQGERANCLTGEGGGPVGLDPSASGQPPAR